MVSFHLRSQVLKFILAVSGGVESNTAFAVCVDVLHSHAVPPWTHGLGGQFDSLALEHAFVFDLLIIDKQVCNCETTEVEEEFSILDLAICQVEVNGGTTKIMVSFLQGYLELVLYFLYDLLPPCCFFLGQLASCLVLRVHEEVISKMLEHESTFSVAEFEHVGFLSCFYHLK